MADRATFQALAERCETAEGPVWGLAGPMRALNESILLALGWTQQGADAIDPSGNRALSIPDYVSSIDAALTIVPAGLFPTIDFVTKRVFIRDAQGFDVAWGNAFGFAPTVPLSICAAALRVRAEDDALWDSLKAECCADPSKATKCVMVGKDHLSSAIAKTRQRIEDAVQATAPFKASIRTGDAEIAAMALADAVKISERMRAGGYRASIANIETLLKHVRKLAAVLGGAAHG